MVRTFVAALSLLVIYSGSFAQARIFQPEIISTQDVFATSFSPDGQQIYYIKSFGGRKTLQLWTSERKKGTWSKPGPLLKNIAHRDIDPFISPDGQTLYFNSDRPWSSPNYGNRFHIWKMDRRGKGWGEPVYMKELNSDSADFFLSVDKNHTAYFASARALKAGSTGIWMARRQNQQYEAPVFLDSIINQSGTESNPYISPDGDYLIFLRSDGTGQGDSDLYISFYKNNRWSKPVNLGNEINTELAEFAPYVSPDQQTLYFTRMKRGTPLVENIYCYPGFNRKLADLRGR